MKDTGLSKAAVEKLRYAYLIDESPFAASQRAACSLETAIKYYKAFASDLTVDGRRKRRRKKINESSAVDGKRKQGQQLDAAKAAELRAAFNEREPIKDAAKRLDLCESCVSRWYEIFRTGGKHPTEEEKERTPRRALPDRHYRGNFEL